MDLFVSSLVISFILLIALLIVINRLEDVKSKLLNLELHIKALDYNQQRIIGRVENLELWEDERYEREQDALQMADEPVEYVNIADEQEAYVDSNLSINERILMREEEFDRRISAMKGAPILHPDVHNIPHQAVDLRLSQLPDVEETD